ncbi:hypothetical protein [Streptomyces sp. NPDC053560]|uniref:hypothetical protein n=1 Tax=Streptomyces sp. NPDC053560 TaxID=3365711 RepID=UPI0037D78A21
MSSGYVSGRSPRTARPRIWAIGKRLGVRVADLLGGGAVTRVPSSYSSGVGEPDAVAVTAEAMSPDWQRSIAVNLTAAFLLI